MLELIEIEHHVGLTAEISFKSVEGDPDDIPVTHSMAGRNPANVEPYFVN